MVLLSEIAIWVAFLIASYFLIFWLLVLLDEDPNKYKNKKKLTHFPMVSIVLPAFNEENNIIASLKSLLNMDYPKNKLQIIVVNDGSTDKTKDVVQNFIKNNKAYDISIISQQNKGKGAALRTGFSHASGDIILIQDADFHQCLA